MMTSTNDSTARGIENRIREKRAKERIRILKKRLIPLAKEKERLNSEIEKFQIRKAELQKSMRGVAKDSPAGQELVQQNYKCESALAKYSSELHTVEMKLEVYRVRLNSLRD